MICLNIVQVVDGAVATSSSGLRSSLYTALRPVCTMLRIPCSVRPSEAPRHGGAQVTAFVVVSFKARSCSTAVGGSTTWLRYHRNLIAATPQRELLGGRSLGQTNRQWARLLQFQAQCAFPRASNGKMRIARSHWDSASLPIFRAHVHKEQVSDERYNWWALTWYGLDTTGADGRCRIARLW